MSNRTMMAGAALVALGFTGCGGGGGPGGDGTDPEAVANAYMESLYRCGERGAGVRAELAYPESAAEDLRREAAEEERPGDCKEQKPKEFQTARVPSREPGIPAVVEVSNEDCPGGEVPMIKAEGRWLVDESEVSADLICNPYAN